MTPLVSHSPPEPQTLQRLQSIARECRIELLRRFENTEGSQAGASLSALDLIVALYFQIMRTNPNDPKWNERDRFVLSKSHAVPAFSAILAKHGAISNSELSTLGKINSSLQGHPDRFLLSHLEASTGSQGQGLSVAAGIALGLRLQKIRSQVFCLMGDGESQEGQVWEAARSASHFGLGNLTVFLDKNQPKLKSSDKDTAEFLATTNKWKAFHWNVLEIDGHDFTQILEAAALAKKENEKPTLILARTIKGKGVAGLEEATHGKQDSLTKENLSLALNKLIGDIP